MAFNTREFQVFAKPVGAVCNLACTYCYYSGKRQNFPEAGKPQMSDEILEQYIVQHIDATTGQTVFFSWHGGEPTVAGLDFYRKVTGIQRKKIPAGKKLLNGIQTNGTLLNDEWCRFLKSEGFLAGISIDGPPELHNCFRIYGDGKPTHTQAIRGLNLLKQYGIPFEILCVVHSVNVLHPLEVYNYLKNTGARFITFLPLVEVRKEEGVISTSSRTVPAYDFGKFLSTIFDQWVASDIGKVRVQIFEEATRVAFGQEHTLCIFKPVCGGVPVIESNGNFYACDHFVDAGHLIGNIRERTIEEMLDSPRQTTFGLAKKETLPRYCRECTVKDMCNGECPKNRFISTPDGEYGLNYLCEGYRQFFSHCKPFVDEVAKVWKNQL